jgi:hypothetical protein
MNEINGILEARRVTVENMKELERWCVGWIRPTPINVQPGYYYIQLNEDDIARVGDWIVNTIDGFKTLSDAEYQDIMSDQSRYEKVLEIVMAALTEQDASTYHGRIKPSMKDRAKDATQKILEIM